MTKEMMTTRDVALYLGLNEKKIYQLAKNREIPAARVGGKWIFPRSLIDRWIHEGAEKNLKASDIHPPLSIMGSNDMAWEILGHILKNPPYNLVISRADVGSVGGLVGLSHNMAQIAGVHLFDPETGTYNLPFLKDYLQGKRVVVATLFYRKQGLMIRKKNPLNVKGIEDLQRPDVRFINRQKGSGTRILLDSELKRLKIDPAQIRGYHHEVDTHMAIALEIIRGKADVGMGIFAAARSLDLNFIPVKDERYDLVILGEYIQTPMVEILLQTVKTPEFREALLGLGGYDLRETGKIIWEGIV
jgi:putative molybdopterin biosynthesis protein